MEEIKKLEAYTKLQLMRPPAESASVKHWKGYTFLPMFSPNTAEYAYDKWSAKEGDVFVASYPKTGTNWTMEIMRQILFQEEPSRELVKNLPISLKLLEVDPCEKFDVWDKLPLSRRLIGTHLPAELVNIEKIKKANAKVVYVLRNPKDQIVSLQKFFQQLPVPLEVKEMVTAEWSTYFEHVLKGNIPVDMKHGEWYPEHILGWYKHCDNKNVCFVYYEDLKKDLTKEIRRLAKFVRVELTDDRVLKIKDASTFGNMKKNLCSGNTMHAKLVALNMRKGESGGWKEYFTVSQSERIDQMFKEKLKETDVQFTYQL